MHNVSDPTHSSHDYVEQDRSESTPLYANVVDTNTFRLIVAFFFGFTVTVTAALGVQIYYGSSKIERHGSVVSDSEICSEIGTAILKQGGNAVDAAVAVGFCLGVVQPHITGLGSGGYMLIYDQRERKVMNSIDFRVTKYSNTSTAGVPGFVAGMVLAHQLHGVLPWKQLITPAEHIARSGFPVTKGFKTSEFYLFRKNQSSYNQALIELLESLQIDEVISNNYLADTLSFLANSDPMEFYKNKSMLLNDVGPYDDINEIIEYKAIESTAMKDSFWHHSIIVPSHGSGGPLLLENLKHVNESLPPLVSAIDAFKSAAENWSISSGTNVAVADHDDIYVSVVSGLGSVLGSQVLTKSGYIMNNMMAVTQDKVSQRPQTLITPMIVLENGKVCGKRLILGAGDVRDVAQTLIYLLRNSTANITDILEAPRVRVQTPRIEYESRRTLSEEETAILKDAGFKLTKVEPEYSSINVIQKVNDFTSAYADPRGGGYGVVF